jgi:hypothetical protein
MAEVGKSRTKNANLQKRQSYIQGRLGTGRFWITGDRFACEASTLLLYGLAVASCGGGAGAGGGWGGGCDGNGRGAISTNS